MRIFCKLCSRKFESAGAIETEAGKIFNQMAEHMAEHPQQAQELAMSIKTAHALIAIYLLSEYVEVPPDETQLAEWLDKGETELANVFGFVLKDEEGAANAATTLPD